MKNTIIVAMGLFLSTAFAFADSDQHRPTVPAPAGSGALQETGAYKATAYGIRHDAHSGAYGFYVRGYGGTQKAADENALDRCQTISEGGGCSLVD
jgi:hypothetical protein